MFGAVNIVFFSIFKVKSKELGPKQKKRERGGLTLKF